MIYSLLPFQVYLSICSALSPPRSGASMSPLQRKRRVRDYGSMRLPAAMSPIQSMFHRTCPLMSRVAPPTLSQWFHPCSTYVVPKRAVMCSTYIVPDEHYTIGRCSNYVVSSKPKRWENMVHLRCPKICKSSVEDKVVRPRYGVSMSNKSAPT